MDFGLSENQNMLKTMAREFFEKECPKELVREMEGSEKGYPPELYSKMAELGWTGLVFPSGFGGMDGDFLDLMVLVEEMGRALAPSPFISAVVHCGLAILEAGTEEHKKQFLPDIVAGNLVLTLAMNELSDRFDAEGIQVKATVAGHDFVINGTKMFVQDARAADYLLVVTRTHDGITPFLIDARAEGISYVELKTMAGDKQFEVVFDKVKVPAKNMIGNSGNGWGTVQKIKIWGTLVQCALMVGMCQRVLEMAVQYAKERVQFDHPIGSYQAIQHKLANMTMDVDGARFVAYQAAWKLVQGLPVSADVSAAKAWANEACGRVCAEAHQIHGGIGFTWDHDLQLYSRRTKGCEIAFGDTDMHREVVAKHAGL